MTRIKICGLSRRSVTPEQVRVLRAQLFPEAAPVGVFVDQPPEAVAALLNDGTLSIAQLHGGEDAEYAAALRRAAPEAEIWKAIQVRGPADLERAASFPADRILLDSGQGTGKRFDWSLLKNFPRPYLLAGGLTPDNLREAVRVLHPYGVDLSSGVETDGVKDFIKIQAAVAAAREE